MERRRLIFDLHLPLPHLRYITSEEIIALPEPHLARLREHALAFACLEGNAFPDVIDSYLPEAYTNLWNNSALGDIPNLYPVTAIELSLLKTAKADIEDHLPTIRREVLEKQIKHFNSSEPSGAL